MALPEPDMAGTEPFLFQGGGGLNGVVSEPLGDDGAGDRSALERGLLLSPRTQVTRRRGHLIPLLEDQEATLNFQIKANPKVTEVAKPLVEHYYGSDIEHQLLCWLFHRRQGRHAHVPALSHLL